MKTLRFAAWSTPLSVALLVFTHCSGGDSKSVGGDGGDKNTASGSGGGGGSGSGSGGTGTGSGGSGDDGGGIVESNDSGGAVAADGGGAGEAGAVASPPIPVPEAGAPSDPGYVECNGAPCSVTTNYCCKDFAADGGQSCNLPNAACASVKQGCNESSDCTGGVCCETINGIGVPGDTACSSGATCPATTTFQVCRTDGECGTDAGPLQKCIPQTCTNPTTHVSFDVEACAVGATSSPYTHPALYGCVAK